MIRVRIDERADGVTALDTERMVRRVAQALCRYGDGLGLVRVRLRVVRELDGRDVHHCAIAANLATGGRVFVRGRAVEFDRAVDVATDRLGHAVGERLAARRLSAEVSPVVGNQTWAR